MISYLLFINVFSSVLQLFCGQSNKIYRVSRWFVLPSIDSCLPIWRYHISSWLVLPSIDSCLPIWRYRKRKYFPNSQQKITRVFQNRGKNAKKTRESTRTERDVILWIFSTNQIAETVRPFVFLHFPRKIFRGFAHLFLALCGKLEIL